MHVTIYSIFTEVQEVTSETTVTVDLWHVGGSFISSIFHTRVTLSLTALLTGEDLDTGMFRTYGSARSAAHSWLGKNNLSNFNYVIGHLISQYLILLLWTLKCCVFTVILGPLHTAGKV